jgi:hypothetical protein
MLDRYRYGIINHCDYPIRTGKLQKVNNKIKANELPRRKQRGIKMSVLSFLSQQAAGN